jgi:hypothetical protein
MKRTCSFKSFRFAALSVAAGLTLGQLGVRGADHGDSPVPSNNQEVDIADVFAFMDPSMGNGDNVILIVTIRGFIAAGENSNFGIFDPNVRYHFEIENTGDTKADKFIDVTFSPRTGQQDPANPTAPSVLEVPAPQTADIKFTNFKDAGGQKLKGYTDLPVTPSSAAVGPAPAQVTSTDESNGIKFFAGMVDDPFFFDIPAFGAFIKSVREGMPSGAAFERGRDSFAGYNIMGIALSIPKSLLVGSDGGRIGVAFYAQKPIVQSPSKKTGEIKGTGAFKTLDRMGNPAVNVALIPFSRKNEYNQGTPKDDANLRFGIDILRTLKALGTMGTGIDDSGGLSGPVEGNALALANVAVLNGDYLRLDTAVANTETNPLNGGDGDNAEASFPNGRRLSDDTVDILLTLINNSMPLGDNVNGSDPVPQAAFPFLALPNQPLPRGGALPAPDANVDDKTRN